MKELSKLMSSFEPSATIKISKLINENRAKGLDVIDFGIGEPNFDLFDNIKNAGIKAILDNKNRYTPVSGIHALKSAIVEKFRKENNISYDESQIVVSNGAKHSLSNIISVLANRGDEFIMAKPYWVSYSEQVKLPGAVSVIVNTDEKLNVRSDLLAGAVTDKTKALILNSPCNPTGKVISLNELKRIADLAIEKDLYVISDEVYEHFVYDDNKHHSIASLNEDICKRTITVNACSKTYSMTGLRIGYSGGPTNIMKMIDTLQGQTTSCPSSIAQEMAVSALKTPQVMIDNIRNDFLKKRNICVKMLNESGFNVTPPEGAFFAFANIEFTDISSLEFADKLMKNENVGVVPGSAFGDDRFIRINYAVPEDVLIKGLQRIKRFVNQ